VKHRDISTRAPSSIGAMVRQIVEQGAQTAHLALPLRFHQRIERFASELALWGPRTNLTAHPEDPAEIAFHVIDSLAPLYAPIPEDCRPAAGKRVLDLGSGAGFPGLVLAAAVEALFILVEARRKRASFLKVAASAMALDNVDIRCVRVSEATMESGFEIVMARAVGAEVIETISKATVSGGVTILWINPGQEIDSGRIRRAGFEEHARAEYRVKRGGAEVQRMLLVFRKNPS
jgi:16S rRNA (guanine(527)-N(7))-methyltransferase RsmG